MAPEAYLFFLLKVGPTWRNFPRLKASRDTQFAAHPEPLRTSQISLVEVRSSGFLCRAFWGRVLRSKCSKNSAKSTSTGRFRRPPCSSSACGGATPLTDTSTRAPLGRSTSKTRAPTTTHNPLHLERFVFRIPRKALALPRPG